MAQEITFHLQLPLHLYQLEEAGKAESQAKKADGKVYTWKTSGNHNWLEKGISNTDTLGLVVVPNHLPDTIDLPDDSLQLRRQRART